MVTVEGYDAAHAIPELWDSIAPSYFQQREFLRYAERYNPCRLRYYAIRDGGALCAGAIVYTLRLDLLTFVRIPSPVRMHIIGVPVSTATAGYFGDPGMRQELLRHVTHVERGMLVTLNADPADDLPAGTRCRMIPTNLFENRFADWEEYVSALRSPHRRRLHQIEAAAEQLRRVEGGCSAFTQEHFELYKQVRGHASATLEFLTLEFFQNLPPRFTLCSYYRERRLVSWTITVHDGTMFMYFFGGMDYAALKKTHSYFVGLSNIVRECVERHHPLLDLGQTADDPKLRFGGRPEPKAMYLTHHRAIVRLLFRWLRPLLEYRGRSPVFHVFRALTATP